MGLVPPAPTPVLAFADGLIHWIDDNFIDPYREAYDWISADTDPMEWRYVVVTLARATPAGTVEDLAQFGLNITNITGGELDTTWDQGDYTQVETSLLEWVNRLVPSISTTHTFREFRWYVRRFNPDLPLGSPATTLDPATQKPYNRFENTGTAVRVTPLNIAGLNATGVLPYQVAFSITFRTAQRAHWGRVYLPGATAAAIDGTTGRWLSSAVNNQAAFMAELVDDLATNDFQLVVPATQAGGDFHIALQQVSQIQVDNLADVIRRRRPKQASLRAIGAPLP